MNKTIRQAARLSIKEMDRYQTTAAPKTDMRSMIEMLKKTIQAETRKLIKAKPKATPERVAAVIVKNEKVRKRLSNIAMSYALQGGKKPKRPKQPRMTAEERENRHKELKQLYREERKLRKEAGGRKGGVELRKVQKRIQELEKSAPKKLSKKVHKGPSRRSHFPGERPRLPRSR